MVNESDVPISRVWGHKFFNLLTKQASGLGVSDSQSGYRAFSMRALELLSFTSRSFSVESEMQFLAHQHNLRVVEVPIIIRYKDAPKRSVLQHGMIVLNGVLQLTGQYRPLLYFGMPGMVMLIGGLLWGLWVVDIYEATQKLAIGYAIASTLFTIIGMITLSTAITLHSVRGLLLDFFIKSRAGGPPNGS